MSSLKEIISINLKRIRKAQGLSQRDVAAKMGVIQAQYSRMEIAKVEATLSSIEKAAEALEVNILELFKDPNIQDLKLDQKLNYIHDLSSEDQNMIVRIIDMALEKDQEILLKNHTEKRKLTPKERLAKMREETNTKNNKLNKGLGR